MIKNIFWIILLKINVVFPLREIDCASGFFRGRYDSFFGVMIPGTEHRANIGIRVLSSWPLIGREELIQEDFSSTLNHLRIIVYFLCNFPFRHSHEMFRFENIYFEY